MSLSDFRVIVKIGEGSFSSVHKVRRLSDNKEYALKKVISWRNVGQTRYAQGEREVELAERGAYSRLNWEPLYRLV